MKAGVNFASTNNLRLSIKSSGHDLLGRSTAKNSLLIWTHYLANVTFSESFEVNGTSVGSAVTVGPGVALNAAYLAAKAQGKIIVGGTAASVAPSGGFVQGAGHSAFSPLFGLAADVALRECYRQNDCHFIFSSSYRIQGCHRKRQPLNRGCRELP